MSFEGSIGEIDLVGRLVELGREHFTGAIRFEQDGIIKIIYFKGGDVLSASTNDRKDAIDEILLRAGKVGREHIKQALAKRQESETLGDALLNLGFITRKELTWARRVQVIGILRSVRSWTNGTYAIVADYLPKREEGTLFPLAQIIVEFIVTEQNRPTFDRAMDGGEAVFHKTAAFDTAFPALDLNEDAAEIVKNIDGEKSAGEIAASTGAEAFNVYKLLEAMRLLGLIDKAGAPAFAPPVEVPVMDVQPKDDLSFESIGVADAADAWNATEAPAAIPEPQPELQFQTEPEPEPVPDPVPQPEEPPASFGAGEAKVPFALHLEPGQMQPPPPPPTPVIEDKAWGFDEAQIEAAERAALPHPPMMPRKRPPTMSRPMLTTPAKKKGGGMRFALIMILLIAGIAIGGWLWWQGRQQTPAPAVATPPAPRRVIQPATPAPPPVVDTAAQMTGTVVPAPATTTATASTTTVATTTTAPPPPQKKPVVATNTAPPPSKSRLETSTQGGGRVITNVPPMTPAVTDAGREKYDAMARQYAQNPSGAFTVQFELVCQTASLARAINNGGANVWFLQTTYRGQSCYRVFWGHFDSRDAAVAGLSRIPAALKGSTPVVVSVPKS